MSEQIVRVPEDEVDGDEGWVREGDEPDLQLVEAIRDDDEWQVIVAVAEFLREEPLESELRQGMHSALSAVAGVEKLDERDREVWVLWGTPSGQELVRAAASVVDALADRARQHVDSLGD